MVDCDWAIRVGRRRHLEPICVSGMCGVGRRGKGAENRNNFYVAPAIKDRL